MTQDHNPKEEIKLVGQGVISELRKKSADYPNLQLFRSCIFSMSNL